MIYSLPLGNIFRQISSISPDNAGEWSVFGRVLIESGAVLLGICLIAGLLKKMVKNAFRGRENVIPIQIDEIRREISDIEHEEKEKTGVVSGDSIGTPMEIRKEGTKQKKEIKDTERQVKAKFEGKTNSNEDKEYIISNSYFAVTG